MENEKIYKEHTKNIKWRIFFRLFFILLLLFAIIQALDFFSFRKFAIQNSKEKAHIIAGLVKTSLTSFMKLGIIDKRNIFIKNLESLENVDSIQVIRGFSVNKQFGEGEKFEKVQDDLQRYVLSTGKTVEEIQENLSKVIYRLIIPYKAENECLNCHQVRVGEVLGAIDVKIDLTSTRQLALRPLFMTAIIMFIAFIVTAFVISKFFNPYTEFFYSIKEGLEKAKEGDFSHRIQMKTQDEAEMLANAFNNMNEKLSFTLKTIEEKVSNLIGHSIKKTGNDLKDSLIIIEELNRIYNFKRVIENDTSKEDIYNRIITILEDWNIKAYSFYELDDTGNNLKIIKVEGNNQWCDNSIFENADNCRAKRTGLDVNSEEFECICPYFIECKENKQSGKWSYYCIPIFIGGSVKNILQIVYEKEDTKVKEAIPFVKSYLLEASPVIEAKSLLSMLKEQSTIDSLTGLFNRRFLEELIPKLIAQSQRRGSNIGILMIDIDFFKQVNDKFGHDVGDKVLKEVANLIKSSIREADIAVRYGGEEFLVLLIDVEQGKSVDIAEKIRKKVENKILNIGHATLNKTVSIGVAEYPIDSKHFWQTIKFADIALYKAKESGRNRVVRFDKSMWKGQDY